MERMNYTPDELREAFRYLKEQGGIHLCNSHAANWRSKFTLFIDAMMKNQEALRLIVRLLDGHTRVSGTAWYKAAADRKAAPLPSDRYERLALGWQLVFKAMPKSNPDGFDKNEKVDLPYVLVNSDLEGEGFGGRFLEFRLRYLEPFIREFETAADDLLAAIPKGATSVDLWDAALAAFQKPATAEAPPPGALARAIAAEEAAMRARAEGRDPDAMAADAQGKPAGDPASAPGAAEAADIEPAPVSVEEGLPSPRARRSKKVEGEKPAKKAKPATAKAKPAAKPKPDAKAKGAPKGKKGAAKEEPHPAVVEEKRPAPGPAPPPPPPPAEEDRDTTRIRDVASKAREKAARARKHPS